MATQKEQVAVGSMAAATAKNAPASDDASAELNALREKNAQLERENARLCDERATAGMSADGGGDGYRNVVGDGRTVRKGLKWPFKVSGRGKDKDGKAIVLEPAVVQAVDASEAVRLYCVHEPVNGEIRVSDAGQVLATQRNKHLDPSSFSFKAENLRQDEFAAKARNEYVKSWAARFPGDKAPSQIPANLVPSFA